MKKRFIVFITLVVLMLLAACAANNNGTQTNEPSIAQESPVITPAPAPEETQEPEQPTPAQQPPEQQTYEDIGISFIPLETAEVTITFEYTRQSGPASNQHAVWIEDMDGNLVKSLFASRWTANGGFKTRPDSIALWAQAADLANMSSADVDAVAGATPSSGVQTYIWDLTDMNGEPVEIGEYKFFVEGTLRWRNFVLYSGIIPVRIEAVTVQGEAVFHYEASERYDALTADSPENNMIGPVTVTYTP